MIGLSGVRFASSINGDQNLEKRAQRINTIATGITAAGVAGTAVAAGAVIKYSQKEGNLLVKVSTAATNLVSKAVNPLKEKLAPTFASLTAKVTPSLTAAKDKVIGNAVVQKLVATGAVAAAVIAEKGQSVFSSVKNYATSLPKPVKIAALAAAGILAVSHVYRSGQISGIFAAPKQESSGQ
ncbi:MAG: hypothetical protein A2039_02395 [Candidatus Melainabacteria bacterium GWA2_34_9]|nr:MAG: hypothetical protein A2039_02395 [Candidatus Melainabacteria bacterium GWA2_34_9]